MPEVDYPCYDAQGYYWVDENIFAPKVESVGLCGFCGLPGRFVEANFECHICSTLCAEKMWEEYFEMLRQSDLRRAVREVLKKTGWKDLTSPI